MKQTIAQQLEIKDFPFEIKDKNGKVIYSENSDGYWWKSTHDEKGNKKTYENSSGYWYKRTYDEKGNEKTYEDSNGFKRGFDKKEMTISEIEKELGYGVKIVK